MRRGVYPRRWTNSLPGTIGILIGCVVALFTMGGCTDMYDQPSVKAQEAPRIGPPEGSVPVTGNEIVGWGTPLTNPVPRSRTSIERGRELFVVNCAMCHGSEGRGGGLVGERFVPPPPQLVQDRIRQLGDADLFKRVTLGFGRMPAFRQRITAEDRWHVVNYVRELLYGREGGEAE